MKFQRHILVLSLLSLLLAGCRVDKHIGENDRLLRKNEYVVEMPDGGATPKEIEEVLTGLKKYEVQSPNSSFLGMRFGMFIYCLSSPTGSNWLNRYLQRQGSAPVVYSPDAAYRTSAQIQNLLESKGCFNTKVFFDTVSLNRRDLKVVYHISPSQRYRIERVHFHSDSEEVTQLLNEWKPESHIKAGNNYDADMLVAERERIVSNLRNEGYFQASKENLIFYLDTANDDGTLDINVNLHNPLVRGDNGQVESVPFRIHCIDKVLLYPNGTTITSADTLVYPHTIGNRTTNYYFIDTNQHTISPKVLSRAMFLFNGMRYRDRNVERTYNALLALRNFKYINIEFTPSPRSNADTAFLDAHVRLMPSKRQRVSASLEINNSSSMSEMWSERGYSGVEMVLSYQNKNLFNKSAGQLNVDLTGLVELPKTYNKISSLELGTDVSLDLPTMLIPFNFEKMWQSSRPHTLFGLGVNYQNRINFERLMTNISFGYSWNQRRNHQHQLLPLEYTFARIFNIDPTFWAHIESLNENGRLKYKYSNHFILDARYDYTYTNQLFGSRQDFSYLHFSVESAGNLLWGLSKAFHFPTDENGVYQVYGVPFSQYARVNGEFKHYFYHGKRCTFVTRAMVGAGIPFGNSKGMQMPYEKSFFGGGPSTLRAWNIRRLGPGMSQRRDSILDLTGDMTLVLNLEERFPLFSILEGAVFADIGNVWLYHNNPEIPNGQFSFKTFIPSLAVGTGFGLRANVSILTIRLDVGLAVYDPGYAKGERFRVKQWFDFKTKYSYPNFGPMTLNFGIDYPF